MLTPRLAFAITVPLLLVAGCSDDQPDAVDEPAASAPATAGIDYPAEGVDLVNRPEMKGAYTQALQTYVDFERGRREAARVGKVGRLLSFNGTASVVEPYRRAVATYAARGHAEEYGGVVAVEFLRTRTRDTVLVVDVCLDGTGLAVPDGAPALLGEATRAPQRIQVTNIVGPWRVTRVDQVAGTC